MSDDGGTMPVGLLVASLLASSSWAGDGGGGHSIYVAKCQACHGASGKGDGPAAAALPSRPPDFTSSDFWKGMSDDRLKSTISGGKPGGVMRPFPMTSQQMTELVAYLRTYQPK